MGVLPDSDGSLFFTNETEEEQVLLLAFENDIGVNGKGLLSIKGNSIASYISTGGSPATMRLGVHQGGDGTLVVAGSKAQFLGIGVNPLELTVGDGGKGDLQIIEGGKAQLGTLWFGRQATGFGSGFVGEGSELFTKKLAVGTGAFGLLQVEEGANVITDLLWVGPNGTVQGPLIAVDTFSAPSKRRAGGLFTDTLIVSGNATLEVDSLVMGAGASLGGTAVWSLPITSTGTITPGDSMGDTGIFTAGAGYTQTGEGVLAIELGPDGTDRLDVTGTAVLGGIVRFDLVGEHRPLAGEQFDIVTASQITGLFAKVEAVPGLLMRLVYETNRVIAVVDAVTVNTEEEAMPTTFNLDQNYPNPFNPQTVIGYEVAEPGHVSLIVYDLLGREVERLIDEAKAVGRYEVVFDAGDLPSGVYLYRLSIGTRRVVSAQSRRMVLMK